MDIIESKTIDMLTTNNVSILTQKFIELDGIKQQVGNNHRRAYQNSLEGRDTLINVEPPDVVDAVLAIWGDSPTVVEQQVDEIIQREV